MVTINTLQNISAQIPVTYGYGRCAKSWTVPERRIDVWANQTHKSASWTVLDSPLFGATTIIVAASAFVAAALCSEGDHGIVGS